MFMCTVKNYYFVILEVGGEGGIFVVVVCFFLAMCASETVLPHAHVHDSSKAALSYPGLGARLVRLKVKVWQLGIPV